MHPPPARAKGALHAHPSGPPQPSIAAIAAADGSRSSRAADRQTANVVLITLDGVRIEEMFGGLDEAVARAIVKTGAARGFAALAALLGADTRGAAAQADAVSVGHPAGRARLDRREPGAGSVMRVTNRHRFSYPGYAEIATGAAHDAEIDSNDNRRNPFPTVLEIVRRERGARSACSRDVRLMGDVPLDRRARGGRHHRERRACRRTSTRTTTCRC